MREFSSIDDITAPAYFIFKHSNTCPISSSAYRHVAAAEPQLDIPVYMIIVQNNRPLSSEIASRFGIRHESPQIILVSGGRAVWNASHYDITAANMQKARDKA